MLADFLPCFPTLKPSQLLVRFWSTVRSLLLYTTERETSVAHFHSKKKNSLQEQEDNALALKL